MLTPQGGNPSADRLHVDLGTRSYEVHVGEGLLAQAGTLAAPLLAARRVAIVTDETVAALYLDPLRAAFDRADIDHCSVVLPPGESTKDFDHLRDLAERLLDAGVERATALVALGGGVVGDITGFAAGILLRGLDWVQVPTTLLAQVDSSVGGKTGINTRHGKNLIGVFHQPRLVLADIGTLDTLPDRQLLAGYAEVVKYGLIGDAGFFAWLEGHGAAVHDGDRAARQHAVMTSCAAKAAIVAEDEREGGRRALLNLGHTFGHALEAETGFSDALLHGEAVAIGMALAFDLSARLGLCPVDDAARVHRHLTAIGLPAGLDGTTGRLWSAEALMAHMAHDKKVRDGRLTLILARGIGQAFITRDVDTADIRGVLADAIAA